MATKQTKRYSSYLKNCCTQVRDTKTLGHDIVLVGVSIGTGYSTTQGLDQARRLVRRVTQLLNRHGLRDR